MVQDYVIKVKAISFTVRGVDFELVKETLACTPEIRSNLTGGVRYSRSKGQF